MSLFATNLSVSIDQRIILNGLNFRCEAGEITAIIGENGAGKSTLINCLAGTSKFSGTLLLNQQPIQTLSFSQLAAYRAVLPQNSSLNFPLSVREVVRLALSLSALSNPQQDTIIEDCLSLMDAKQFIERNYLHLSGGEKQRVQLARVLAQLHAYHHDDARFLLLDEPTSALDLKHQYATLHMLRHLCSDAFPLNIGILIILHDLNLASLYCDKILLIKEGQLVAHDVPAKVLKQDLLEQTFDVDLLVNRHPNIDKPYLIPKTI